MLLGSWINTGLMAIEVTQVVRYYRGSSDDALPVKVAVGTVFALDLTATWSIFAGVYLVSALDSSFGRAC